jgi:hypothetical protein
VAVPSVATSIAGITIVSPATTRLRRIAIRSWSAVSDSVRATTS